MAEVVMRSLWSLTEATPRQDGCTIVFRKSISAHFAEFKDLARRGISFRSWPSMDGAIIAELIKLLGRVNLHLRLSMSGM